MVRYGGETKRTYRHWSCSEIKRKGKEGKKMIVEIPVWEALFLVGCGVIVGVGLAVMLKMESWFYEDRK